MYIDNDLMDLVTRSSMKSGNNYGTGMLIIHPETGEILLGIRSDTKNWCSPGGKVELGESPLQGVLRETLEESGIVVQSCMFYDYEMHTAENGKNWTSFMFASNSFDSTNLLAQQGEIDGEWGWYPLDYALTMNLFPPTRKSIERAIQAGVLEGSLKSNENFIPFVECPTSTIRIKDGCCCAYSSQESQDSSSIFDDSYLLPWD
mgnify:FL=1